MASKSQNPRAYAEERLDRVEKALAAAAASISGLLADVREVREMLRPEERPDAEPEVEQTRLETDEG